MAILNPGRVRRRSPAGEDRPAAGRSRVRTVVSLALAVCLLPLGAGCRHPNTRRHRDDVKMKVVLTREFVRRNMEDVPKPHEVTLDMFESLLEDPDDLQEFAAGFFLLVLMAPAVYTVENAIEHADTTKGYIRPSDLKGYRQRLYWGENKVYLPRECAGKVVPLTVEFRGNYAGTHEFEVDLSERRAKVKL